MTIAKIVDIKNTKTLVSDIVDVYGDQVRIIPSGLISFGGITCFHGLVSTIACLDDNSRVREAVNEAGNNRILVVDGQGSLAFSLLGGSLAATAASNGWAGIIINAAVRDTEELKEINIGIKACGVFPRATIKRGLGDRDVPIVFLGQQIKPNDYIYADNDGIVIADRQLV